MLVPVVGYRGRPASEPASQALVVLKLVRFITGKFWCIVLRCLSCDRILNSVVLNVSLDSVHYTRTLPRPATSGGNHILQ